MIQLLLGFLLSFVVTMNVPEVKVAGTMRNIMVKGDLSAHVSFDTLNQAHLFGLGPAPGLKGEIMILDGTVYTSALNGTRLQNQQNKISQAAMLVYSNVEKWNSVNIQATVKNYAELEMLIEATAKAKGYDTEIPFPFKIEAMPGKASYHVINWEDGSAHTMENHKQFAYFGQSTNEKSVLLGFYSKHHQSIFTHHTTNMHIHILGEKTKTVGHLDDIHLNGPVTIFLPGV
ncbi:MAG: acetolactate decarboxylase [Ferruginibacter sp.]|nr:acetolactate decarboxylase [Chitinophagaceae bacterium]